ncbi:hypothetical protein ACMGG9_15405 [Serratia sp. BNK-10]|uniref:hypothetical protein n=1 Tax=Serratia TaxID=613 RepID=UPI0011AB5005|nr:hypothetical protein [Serratia marcescens]
MIKKKGKPKAALTCYAMRALLLFSAIWAKETRRFKCTDFNQVARRHFYHLMLFLRINLNEAFTF